MPSLVEPTHDRGGAASWPSAAMSLTVASVLSRVEPPAPYVTLKNSGATVASSLTTVFSFSLPTGVLGGKNSKLTGTGRRLMA